MSLVRHTTLRAGPAALAGRRYRDADLSQRIAAATPHELVVMLYNGGSDALAAAARATAADDAAGRVAGATRALRILDALDAALDHGRGGAVARALTAAYAQVRAVTIAANYERRDELFSAAAAQLANLGRGWSAIGAACDQRAAA